MKFPSFARLGLLGGSGFLGWLLHSLNVDGPSTGTTVGLVAAALTAAFSLIGDFGTAWKAAGGKLDGTVTAAEAKVINEHIVRKVSPQAADFLSQHLPEATSIANWMTSYMKRAFTPEMQFDFSDKDHNHLVFVAHQVLSQEVAGKPEGEQAAAKLLAVLQEQWNVLGQEANKGAAAKAV
jgi:hypothetical protein